MNDDELVGAFDGVHGPTDLVAAIDAKAFADEKYKQVYNNMKQAAIDGGSPLEYVEDYLKASGELFEKLFMEGFAACFEFVALYQQDNE